MTTSLRRVVMRSGTLMLCAAMIVPGAGAGADVDPNTDAPLDAAARAPHPGNHEQAAEHWRQAVRDQPNDPELRLHYGAALNRLGRFDDALTELQRSDELGEPADAWHFEMGWAWLGLGEYAEALAALEAYEQRRPGQGKTSEFRGRAHLALGELDVAEQLLNEAIERDPALEPTARVHLALVARRGGDDDEARRQLRYLFGDDAAAGVAGPLRDPLLRVLGIAPGPQLIPDVTARPWRLSVSAGGGYDSNVIALANDTPLPADISNRHAWFGRFTLDAAYDILQRPDHHLSVGYGLLATVHSGDHSDSDLIDQTAFANYRHRLRDNLTAGVTLANRYSLLGGSSYRNELSTRPTLILAVTDWLNLEGAYTYSRAWHFFDPATPALDRTGDSHSLGATAGYRLPETELTGRVGYFHTWRRTRGREFEANVHGMFLSVAHPLPWRLDGELTYTHLITHHQRQSIFAATRRRDRGNFLTVQLTRPIDLPGRADVTAYLRYDLSDNRSNLAMFEYDQHIVTTGLIVDF